MVYHPNPNPFPFIGQGAKAEPIYSFVRSFWAGVYSCRRTRNAASKNTPLPNDWHIQCKHTSSLHFGSRWFYAKNPLCLLREVRDTPCLGRRLTLLCSVTVSNAD